MTQRALRSGRIRNLLFLESPTAQRRAIPLLAFTARRRHDWFFGLCPDMLSTRKPGNAKGIAS